MFVSAMHGGEGERHIFCDVEFSANGRGVPRRAWKAYDAEWRGLSKRPDLWVHAL